MEHLSVPAELEEPLQGYSTRGAGGTALLSAPTALLLREAWTGPYASSTINEGGGMKGMSLPWL